MRIHEESVLYNCEHCKFQSKSRTYLKEHIDTKHKEKSYDCSMCDFKSLYRNSLRDHQFRMHEIIRLHRYSNQNIIS